MTDELRDERLSRLYRESAAGEPPPALDAVILAAARAAVAPAPPRRPGWRAWMLPTSLAATVVLTVRDHRLSVETPVQLRSVVHEAICAHSHFVTVFVAIV